MKAAIIVLFILVGVAIGLGFTTMLFVFFRLEKYDKLIEGQNHKIENIRQGGEVLAKRMNRL